MSNDLKTVARYNTPIEADLARNYLKTAFVADDQTVGWLWHLGLLLGGVKVLVAELDMARAQEILAESVQSCKAPGKSWRCPKCGAQVVGNMNACWYCGTTHDGVEDPTFQTWVKPVAEEPQPSEEKWLPSPLLMFLVGVVAPAVTVIVLLLVAGATYLSPTETIALLVISEFPFLVAVFQWWQFGRSAVPVEIPSDRPGTPDEQLPADEWLLNDVEVTEIVRRACRAAIFGLVFCGFFGVLNAYSLWLILRYELPRRVPEESRWLLHWAMVFNGAIIFATLVLIAIAGTQMF